MNHLIFKQKIMIDSTVQEITCRFIANKLQIQLSNGISQNVELTDLKNILYHIDYESVLPYTLPIKLIQDHKTFIQYLVFPFITVKNNQIEIWPQSPGLLSSNEEQQLIWLYHI